MVAFGIITITVPQLFQSADGGLSEEELCVPQGNIIAPVVGIVKEFCISLRPPADESE